MVNNIEVFKTTVQNPDDAELIINALQQRIHSTKINFELEDCDNILRIEAQTIDIKIIENTMKEFGHIAERLE